MKQFNGWECRIFWGFKPSRENFFNEETVHPIEFLSSNGFKSMLEGKDYSAAKLIKCFLYRWCSAQDERLRDWSKIEDGHTSYFDSMNYLIYDTSEQMSATASTYLFWNEVKWLEGTSGRLLDTYPTQTYVHSSFLFLII